MATRVRRSQMEHYLNTGTAGSPIWSKINVGHAALSTSYNAETSTQQWIGEDSGTTTIDSYAPAISTEQIAFDGDPIFDFVDNLAFTMATGSDAETDYIEVRNYGTGTSRARKFRVNISIDSEGDAATDPLTRSYGINFMGDPVYGTWNGTTFTAA